MRPGSGECTAQGPDHGPVCPPTNPVVIPRGLARQAAGEVQEEKAVGPAPLSSCRGCDTGSAKTRQPVWGGDAAEVRGGFLRRGGYAASKGLYLWAGCTCGKDTETGAGTPRRARLQRVFFFFFLRRFFTMTALAGLFGGASRDHCCQKWSHGGTHQT